MNKKSHLLILRQELMIPVFCFEFFLKNREQKQQTKQGEVQTR